MKLPDHRHPCFVIGVVAQLVKMHPQTLRYYEKLGLIQPARTDGGIRLFSMHDVERLHKVQELQEAGVNPTGIKLILELSDKVEKLESELNELRQKKKAAMSL